MEWPAADRRAWEAALLPGDIFEPGGVASRWSAATRRKTAAGYGRFLFWLQEQGALDECVGPEARVTRERLAAYLDELRTMNRGHTLQCRIQELGDALRAMVPKQDWRWVLRAAGRLRASTRPAWNKSGRLTPIADVIAQVFRMMAEAEEASARSALGRAALFRDGLLVVFLAYHPLRLRNLAALRIGRHLVDGGDRLILTLDASETKGRQWIEQELTPRLSAALRRYLQRHRPVLLRRRGRWHRPARHELWISRDGSPCSAETFQNIIAKHLCGPDGRPLSPHLFRSIAATSVATDAPEAVDIIPAILAHGSPAAAERYYNLAGSLDAARAHGALLEALCRQLEREAC
jgi:integrase